MPLKGSTKGLGPKGKGSAVYFASQMLVMPPYNLLEGEMRFRKPGNIPEVNAIGVVYRTGPRRPL